MIKCPLGINRIAVTNSEDGTGDLHTQLQGHVAVKNDDFFGFFCLGLGAGGFFEFAPSQSQVLLQLR